MKYLIKQINILSDMLRRIIVEQVSTIMVLPNKLSIVLSNDVSTHNLKFPEPQVITLFFMNAG